MEDAVTQTGVTLGDASQGAGSGAGAANDEQGQPGAGAAGDGGAAPKYTDEDVQRIIQGRLKSEKQKYQLAQSIVDGLTAATGRNPEELYAELQTLMSGVDAGPQPQPDPQLHQAQALATYAGQVALQTHRQMELGELKQSPTVYAGLDKEDTVNELVSFANQRGLTLKEAYWQLYGEKRAQEIQREVEQRVLEGVRVRSSLGAEGDSVAELEKLGLGPDEIAFAKAQGMNPKDYAALKNVKDLDSFRALKKKGG